MQKQVTTVPRITDTQSRVYRLLFLEDDAADLELIQRELRRGGVDFEGTTVSGPREFLEQLTQGNWDAVLSDFRLPGWTGLDALDELKKAAVQVPFLLITGTLGEEKAVECMRRGVADCILKDRLARLPNAVRQAVELREIRERQGRIAEELWASESKLGLLLSQLPAIIWTTDRELRLTSLTGAGLPRLPQDAWQRKSQPLDQAMGAAHPLVNAHQRALAGESLEFGEEAGGRSYSSRVEPLRDTAGNVVGCLGLSLDVSETKRLENESVIRARELDEASRTLAALVSHAPVAIIALDESETVRIWNPAAEEMFGWKAAEVMGKVHPAVPGERTEEFRVLFDLLRQGGGVYAMETQRRRKDGQILDVSLSASGVCVGSGLGRSGGDLLIIAVLTDITGRKRAEAEMLRLTTAVEQAAESVMIADTNGIIRYVNPAFCAVTGYTREEAVGHRTNLLRSGRHDAEFYDRLWKAVLSGQTWRGEFENRRKDGNLVPMEACITPVRGPRGGITSFICISQDVSERRTLEGQLLEAQKFEAIGQLAGGIAHDFNNVLAAILGMAELGQMEAPEGTRIRERLQKICHHAGRAVALTRQLLAFSRRQQLERRPINLNLCINEVTSLISESLGKDVEVKTELAPELASIHADPSQIEQVLMNLSVNARDAMPRGGQLTFTTGTVRLDADACRGRPGMSPGEFVELSVADTGTGMDATTLGRIFEPFFTTKPPGLGTGLGLATAYGVVKQHGGFIEVDSALGAGTSFHLYFPVAMAAEREAEAPQSAEPVRGGTETILLAEDHEGLRELVRESLQGLGYQVLAANDGQEALDLFRRHAGKVDLLVLDVVMPRLRGPDVYQRIRELNPLIPVLFCTGYNPDSAQGEALSSHPVLQKPYPALELARAVRQLLDQRGPREN
ncbi:MAG TPA: PAS domain S-box protein [Candidatus Acidoferrales bacterium]|nr:PAS domain S-box protein [Candidatus Acidoferrales bacterium]